MPRRTRSGHGAQVSSRGGASATTAPAQGPGIVAIRPERRKTRAARHVVWTTSRRPAAAARSTSPGRPNASCALASDRRAHGPRRVARWRCSFATPTWARSGGRCGSARPELLALAVALTFVTYASAPSAGSTCSSRSGRRGSGSRFAPPSSALRRRSCCRRAPARCCGRICSPGRKGCARRRFRHHHRRAHPRPGGRAAAAGVVLRRLRPRACGAATRALSARSRWAPCSHRSLRRSAWACCSACAAASGAPGRLVACERAACCRRDRARAGGVAGADVRRGACGRARAAPPGAGAWPGRWCCGWPSPRRSGWWRVAFDIVLPFAGSLLMTALLVVGVAVPTPGGVGGFHEAFPPGR